MVDKGISKFLIIANLWLFLIFILLDLRTWLVTSAIGDEAYRAPVASKEVRDELNQLVKAGEEAFQKCAICHALSERAPGFGPSLDCVLDRQIASDERYRFSPGLSRRGSRQESWDLQHLYAFIHRPKVFEPTTRMVFPGLHDTDEIRALIHYLAWSCSRLPDETQAWAAWRAVPGEGGSQRYETISTESYRPRMGDEVYLLPRTPGPMEGDTQQ